MIFLVLVVLVGSGVLIVVGVCWWWRLRWWSSVEIAVAFVAVDGGRCGYGIDCCYSYRWY